MSSNGEYFLWNFSNMEDRESALEAGPFKVGDKLMVVKPWEEDLKSLKKKRYN